MNLITSQRRLNTIPSQPIPFYFITSHPISSHPNTSSQTYKSPHVTCKFQNISESSQEKTLFVYFFFSHSLCYFHFFLLFNFFIFRFFSRFFLFFLFFFVFHSKVNKLNKVNKFFSFQKKKKNEYTKSYSFLNLDAFNDEK